MNHSPDVPGFGSLHTKVPRVLAVAACLAAILGAQAFAQPAASFFDLLPPAADTGKPRLFIPPPLPPRPECRDPLSCRLQLLGEVRKDGAVELRATPWTW